MLEAYITLQINNLINCLEFISKDCKKLYKPEVVHKIEQTLYLLEEIKKSIT